MSPSTSAGTSTSVRSILLPALSTLFGWLYFLSWSISFYPQAILNLRRRSTAGATLSYSFLNISGFTYYSLSNILLYYSATVRSEYAVRNPQAPEPTVRFNDVFFAVHGLLISAITASQFIEKVWGFRQGGSEQRLGGKVWGITIGCMGAVVWMVALAATSKGEENGWGWLDVVYAFGYCKMVITISKYIPQVRANHDRKSTRGFAIEQVLLDLIGGVLSIAQLFIDSYLEGDWSGVTGNPVKFALGQISILFDVVFMVQHYGLYRDAKDTEVRRDVGEGDQGREGREEDPLLGERREGRD